MEDNQFNLSLRQFLKHVGVTSRRKSSNASCASNRCAARAY